MVKIQPLAPAGRMTAVDRAMTKATIQVGKKKCKCSYEMNAKNCKKSTITCDKKCSGKASGVELEDGMYMLDIAVKKGKVTIAKCDVQAAPAPTGTGTYEAASTSTDYEYNPTSDCNLDEGNGAIHPTKGEYSYFMTTGYPWIPVNYNGDQGASRLCGLDL